MSLLNQLFNRGVFGAKWFLLLLQNSLNRSDQFLFSSVNLCYWQQNILKLRDCSDEITTKQERHASQTHEEGDRSVLTSWARTHRSNPGLSFFFLSCQHSHRVVLFFFLQSSYVSCLRLGGACDQRNESMGSLWDLGAVLRVCACSCSNSWKSKVSLWSFNLWFEFYKVILIGFWDCYGTGNVRESWEKLLLALSLLLQGALKCLIFFSLRIFLVLNMEKSLSWFLLSSVLILVSIVQLIIIILASFYLHVLKCVLEWEVMRN